MTVRVDGGLQVTLSFERFWAWLQVHPNCVSRVIARDLVLYDHDALHWQFPLDNNGVAFAQLLHAKLLVAELAILPDRIAYVRSVTPDDPEEYPFDLCTEHDEVMLTVIMTHGHEPTVGSTGESHRWN